MLLLQVLTVEMYLDRENMFEVLNEDDAVWSVFAFALFLIQIVSSLV